MKQIIALTDDEISLYQIWKDKQKVKAKKFYADPFDGLISSDYEIPYLHSFYVGASSTASLLGKSRWNSANDIYDRMINFTESQDSFIFDRGHQLEQFVADQFTKYTHIKNKNGMNFTGEFKGFPYMFAQVDRLTADNRPLEIKTSGFNKSEDGEKLFGKGCVFNSDGILVVEDNKIPEDYYIQCQKQMYLTDTLDYMWLCVWILSDIKVRVFKVHRNEEVIKDIINADYDFIFNHVIPCVPYNDNLNTLDVVDEEPNALYTDDDFTADIKEYARISSEITSLTKKKTDLSKKIKSTVGEHDTVINQKGEWLIKLSKQERSTLNATKVLDNFPDVYKECLESKEIEPRLTVNKKVIKC